mmetsp:Transcript_7922/g.15586  ORF Transcript_7922/g.15586 Transcript_7922/m.15586 type:complete len:482 (-) Transcript_7922:230-1675(-)
MWWEKKARVVLALLLACSLQIGHVDGLIVFTNNKRQGERLGGVAYTITYVHTTAKFGAQQPYNVTGRLVTPKTEEVDGCRHLNATQVQGKVVVLMRGGCNFIDKANVAKAAGAVGIIVGDNQPTSKTVVRMDSGSEEAAAALGSTIPVIFIQGTALYDLSQKLKNPEFSPLYATLNATQDISLARHSFNPHHPRHPLLPFVWLMLGLSYWTRRMMMYYVARRRRRPAVENMPMVDYVALEAAAGLEGGGGGESQYDRRRLNNSSTSSTFRRRGLGVNASPELVEQLIQSATPQQVINPTCTVCFDDFKSGEQVKALPCGHGFHGPCIDPWLLNHSDRCPVCNRSILNPPTAQRAAAGGAAAGGGGEGGAGAAGGGGVGRPTAATTGVSSRRTSSLASSSSSSGLYALAHRGAVATPRAAGSAAAAAHVRGGATAALQQSRPHQHGENHNNTDLGARISQWSREVVHAWVSRTRRPSPGSEE